MNPEQLSLGSLSGGVVSTPASTPAPASPAGGFSLSLAGGTGGAGASFLPPSHQKQPGSGFSLLMSESTAMSWIIFSLLAGGLCRVWQQYFYEASQPTIDPEYESYILSYKEYETQLNTYVPLNGYPNYERLPFIGTPSIISNSLRSIIQANDLNYIHKRDLTYAGLTSLGGDIARQATQLDTIKKNISRYGFFYEELYTLLGGDEEQNSLQRSLISLETIKFSTALRVFSLLDSFTDQFARFTTRDKTQLQGLMNYYISRGEGDISRYLEGCYLNPFENQQTCTLINDFRSYYTYFEPENNFQPDTFLSLLRFIDDKLEETEFPSITMMFDSFDPRSKNLSFTVNVNTLQSDEIQLIRKKIFNPHIYVVSHLVNLLKQSKFILGNTIDIKQLQINKKTYDIGGNQIAVNNSSLRFDIPLQKNTEREVTDGVRVLVGGFTTGTVRADTGSAFLGSAPTDAKQSMTDLLRLLQQRKGSSSPDTGSGNGLVISGVGSGASSVVNANVNSGAISGVSSGSNDLVAPLTPVVRSGTVGADTGQDIPLLLQQ